MNWLLENPLPLLLMGLAAEAILTVLLLQTGRGALLLGMLAIALVTAALVAVESVIVTDREAIEETLFAAAAAVERNDVRGLLRYLSLDAAPLQGEIERIFAQVKFAEARITSQPEIMISQLSEPPSATASFLARIRITQGNDRAPVGSHLGRFRVRLERESVGWRIADYEEPR
jgi:hypothetical protein